MPAISLPVFEGPLDLLLHLIERDDLDITAVSLVVVADQYLTAIHQGDGVDPQALAEFVAIGAKLIYLKSKALLPRSPEEAEALLEDDDVGRELVDLLVEYRRFGEVADLLQVRQELGVRVFPRQAPPPPRDQGSGLDEVTMEGMFKIMLEMMANVPEPPAAMIPRDGVTMSGRLQQFRDRLRRGGKFSFRQAIAECQTRVEVVISFLAILELLKSNECDARQGALWGDIEVVALAPVSA
ncbi:MAG: segregation/condensation protein A [Dehalococcoidia bacterium]